MAWGCCLPSHPMGAAELRPGDSRPAVGPRPGPLLDRGKVQQKPSFMHLPIRVYWVGSVSRNVGVCFSRSDLRAASAGEQSYALKVCPAGYPGAQLAGSRREAQLHCNSREGPARPSGLRSLALLAVHIRATCDAASPKPMLRTRGGEPRQGSDAESVRTQGKQDTQLTSVTKRAPTGKHT